MLGTEVVVEIKNLFIKNFYHQIPYILLSIEFIFMRNDSSVSFNDTQLAFQYKSDKELKQADWLFHLMDKPILVKWGTRITPWMIKNHFPIQGIIRSTIFKQFAGGETLEETAKVADHLAKYHVQVILDYAKEGADGGDAEYDKAAEEFMNVIDYAATQPNIPFMSVKMTGLSRFGLLEKMHELMNKKQGSLMKRFDAAFVELTTDDKAEWNSVAERLDRICNLANEKNVGMLIDAEETWITDPVDALVTRMMDSYNRERPVIYNTAQLYRHDRLKFIKDCHEAAVERGFILGMKLVRGAYMEKERNRAALKNYPSPIQPDKEATDKDYNDSLRFCIDHIDRVSCVNSTHNEDSNMYAVNYMKEKGIPLNHPHMHFSQLYGMSDNITFNLANAGCNVSKYLPFGPIKDVIPYLMRRAQENTSVEGQTSRELSLIKREVARRRKLGV